MIKLLNLSIICLVLISCASEKLEGKTEAEVLYKEAETLVKEERYLLATEKLNNIKNQYPYSYYATPAELMQADIFFFQESYVEAAAAYLMFKDLHPKHEKISYVVYKVAESFYRQIPETNDRDLEPAVEAIKYYQELITKYPSSEQIKDGLKKIAECKNKLKAKEQYIADFYFKTEVFDAARWRYLEILNTFEDKKLRSHSMQRIILSSYYLKDYKNCLKYSENYSSDLKSSDKKIASEYSKYCKNKL